MPARPGKAAAIIAMVRAEGNPFGQLDARGLAGPPAAGPERTLIN